MLGLLAAVGAGVGGAALLGNQLNKTNYNDPSQMDRPTGYAASQSDMIQELLRRHNAGDLNLPPHRVEQLSRAAAELGMKFEVESKPFKKFLFDATDSLTLGLIPNEWRPRSIGEDLHGEATADRWAGGVGTIAGGFVGGGLLLKGGAKALGGLKGWMGKGAAAQGAARSWNFNMPGGMMNSNKSMLGVGNQARLNPSNTIYSGPNYGLNSGPLMLPPGPTQGGLLNMPLTGSQMALPLAGSQMSFNY